jgi:hypothetical protein
MFVKQRTLLGMQQHAEFKCTALYLNKHSQGQRYDVDLSCFIS